MRRILFDTHAKAHRWIVLETADAWCRTCDGSGRVRFQRGCCPDCGGHGFFAVPVGQSAALVARQIARGAIP